MHLILLSPLLFSMHRLCLPLTLKHISLGCFTQAFHFFFTIVTRSRMPQGSYTSPSLSLHPHSLILSLKHKHCMVGISLNLISFILCHLPRSDINIKYSTSPCTAHCISLYLKQIIFPNSSLSIFFMIQDNFSYKQKNQQKTDEKIDQ